MEALFVHGEITGGEKRFGEGFIGCAFSKHVQSTVLNDWKGALDWISSQTPLRRQKLNQSMQ